MSKFNRIGDHWREQQPYFGEPEPLADVDPIEVVPTPARRLPRLPWGT